MYSNIMYYFGTDKITEFVRSDQENILYDRNNEKSGKRGAQVLRCSDAQMLRASKIFGRNMRYNLNFHRFDDESLKNRNSESNVFDLLNELNLPPFHHVITINDGTELDTTRQFNITPVPTEIDFVSTMSSRIDEEKFGDFEFHSLEPEAGREGV